MNLASLDLANLKNYVEEITLEQGRRRNGTGSPSTHEEISGMSTGALKVEADEARRELNRRTAGPIYRAIFN